ncbi:MAG TPA: hypothetical protein DD490_23165, partial [Acidobacteria bacterium]|nr:hypothetical protein [Acidobacteriota bacterium]
MSTSPTALPAAFHLAWYLPHIAGVVGGGARVRYLLVPVVLEKFQATRIFESIQHDGRRAGKVETFLSKVVTLRSPEAPEGTVAAEELLLIAALRERAVLAGLEKHLPELQPTRSAPDWARAV